MMDAKQYEIIEQIFHPKDYLGEKPDYENIDFDEVILDELEDKSIGFLAPDLILEMDNLLRSVKENELEKSYNFSELNSNGIYPENWHDNESSDQAFNCSHIAEGIEQLKSILDRAKKSGNYIFVFSG